LSPFLTEAVVDGRVERPFFLEADGRRIFAVEHAAGAGAAPLPPLIVVHPWFEEKLWAHRVLLDLARRAAAAGHRVLRFDASGHGDSAREVEEVGFRDWERDAGVAWDWLRERTGTKPDVFGLRLGGTVAARLAAREGVRAALWEPALDPAAHLTEVLRGNLTFQMRQHGKVVRNRAELVKGIESGETVMIEGYGLAPRFWLEARDATMSAEAFPGRCTAILVASISKAAPRAGGPVEAAAAEWGKDRPVEWVHVSEEPFWSDVRRHRTASPELTARTLAWLGRRLPGVEA
jgi:pimeloyl-ACP methyl ester carboxylesterase